MNLKIGSPTEILKEEHRVIERILSIFNTACEKLERDEHVSPDIFKKAIDFIRVFADRCHHGKEEETLFPLIEQRGIPREGGPTGVMRMEHDRGRGFVKALAEAVERYERGEENAKTAIIKNAKGYTQLLAEHIPKEDDILYPLADKLLTPEDRKELLEKFEKVEKERIGEGKHHDYIHLVKELEKELKISRN
jgi:hemerythrin-like domain-containing protein